MLHYTALITVLAVLVYFSSGVLVARARRKYGVSLPAISGHVDFERVFRAQMNTLEAMPVFLPLLWLSAVYVGDGFAAAVGLVWVAGRILYIWGYIAALEKRGPGFLVANIATVVLLIGAVAGIIWRMTHGG
jgi:glutathione S-transferase